jgi:Ca2+-binding EF-hand superfamily protein
VAVAVHRLKNEQAHLLGVLGDSPDDLSCLERLKEVDYTMGLLLRPPAGESPRRAPSTGEAEFGARDASPMPLEEDDEDDDEDEDEDADDCAHQRSAVRNEDAQIVAVTASQEREDEEQLRRWKSPEPRAAAVKAARASPRSPTVPKTTGVFAKLTDPGQYTGSHARRHRGGVALSPAGRELVMPSKEERDDAFRRMDYNGNGTLSLAEIDKAVVEVWPQFNHKRALMRAYKAADRNRDGFVERREFRLLLNYIMFFNRLWDEFDAIDTDHDHRLNLQEFQAGCGKVGLELSAVEAEEAFASMDDNGGGYVLFDEFCSWVRYQSPCLSRVLPSDLLRMADRNALFCLPAVCCRNCSVRGRSTTRT